jgi:hypothetical protein
VRTVRPPIYIQQIMANHGNKCRPLVEQLSIFWAILTEGKTCSIQNLGESVAYRPSAPIGDIKKWSILRRRAHTSTFPGSTSLDGTEMFRTDSPYDFCGFRLPVTR